MILIHLISKLFGSLKEGIRDLLFPSFCLECDKLLLHDELFFCACCISLLEYLDPVKENHLERCPSASLKKLATVFEAEGPAVSLARSMTKERIYLAKGIASFMAAFWIHRDYPMPDLVVPMPQPWIKKRGGINPNTQIAVEFAKIVGSRFSNALASTIKNATDEQGRNRLYFEPVLKDAESVRDKTVLLIAMRAGNIEEIAEAADALQEGCPESIYALTLI